MCYNSRAPTRDWGKPRWHHPTQVGRAIYFCQRTVDKAAYSTSRYTRSLHEEFDESTAPVLVRPKKYAPIKMLNGSMKREFAPFQRSRYDLGFDVK